MNSTVYNPGVPFVAPLPGQLQPGQLIRIQGTPHSTATCFSINLQNGSSIDRRSDVALHLSPVFSSPPRLVRNSVQDQQWGPEESHGSHFPFSPGQSFDIMILVEPDHFKVAVNGQHFTEFRYRLPLAVASYLAIDGDVSVDSIKYETISGRASPISPQTEKGVGVTMPIGFVTPDVQSGGGPPPSGYGRPSSPYGAPTYNMPSSSPGQSPYGPPPMTAPYLQPSSIPPPPPPGYPSPVHSPTYPAPGPPPNYPSQGQPSAYPSQHYPSQQYPSQQYPSQPGAYPSHGMYPSNNLYPQHPGPYPGTSVVYPGTEKDKSGGIGSLMGPLAAGAAALAGSGLLASKHGKHGKHGPTSIIADGAAALLGGGGGKHGHHSGSKSSPIPIGGAVAGGAAALAGAYMLSKGPVGHFFK